MTESIESCCWHDQSAWLWFVLDPLFESAATASLELHTRSCTECARRLNFYRKLVAMMDLNTAGPPESWIEEAVARFKTYSYSKSITPLRGHR
jgi:hypothetical protein